MGRKWLVGGWQGGAVWPCLVRCNLRVTAVCHPCCVAARTLVATLLALAEARAVLDVCAGFCKALLTLPLPCSPRLFAAARRELSSCRPTSASNAILAGTKTSRAPQVGRKQHFFRTSLQPALAPSTLITCSLSPLAVTSCTQVVQLRRLRRLPCPCRHASGEAVQALPARLLLCHPG